MEVVGKKLFMIGGCDSNNILSSAEAKSSDSSTHSLMNISPMGRPRAFFASTVIGSSIFVSGGISDYNEAKNEDIGYKSTEEYNSKQDKWTFLKPMLSRRNGHGLVGFHGGLLAFGGYNVDPFLFSGRKKRRREIEPVKAKALCSFEKYNMTTHEWTKQKFEMPKCKAYFNWISLHF